MKWIMRPYSINSNGEQAFERLLATPRPGDLFIIYSLVIDPREATTLKRSGG
ncbi:MAG: hypothetical protein V1862_03560 [Methanobacteriota archaeon]